MIIQSPSFRSTQETLGSIELVLFFLSENLTSYLPHILSYSYQASRLYKLNNHEPRNKN